MANEFRKVTDQNGVDHPVCDDTRVDWSSYAVLGAKNLLNASDSVTVPTSATSFTEIGKSTLKAGQVYTYSCVQETVLTSNTRNTLVVSKPGMSPSIIESDTQNYHLSSGLHKMTFTAPSDGEYTFNVWCHTPSAECTYSQFQVELGSVETPIYAPYAMTNKELTEKATLFNNALYANDLIGYIGNAVIKSANTTADQISAIESFIGSDANYSVRNFVTANNSGQTNGTGMLYKYSNSYAGFFYTSYLTDKLIIGRLYDGTWSTREV